MRFRPRLSRGPEGYLEPFVFRYKEWDQPPSRQPPVLDPMPETLSHIGPDVGERAPDFTLPAANAENVDELRLSKTAASGPVVLAFFPLAFNGTCRNELCTFRDDIGVFHNADAHVLGVSADSTMTLQEFARVEGYQFPLLSDWNREVVPEYAGFHDEFKGLRQVPRRAVFVVDRDREVRYRWITEDSSALPPFDAVQEALPGP